MTSNNIQLKKKKRVAVLINVSVGYAAENWKDKRKERSEQQADG